MTDPNNIGWDEHLAREWNRFCDAQDADTHERRIEEIKHEIQDLEDELYELEWGEA